MSYPTAQPSPSLPIFRGIAPARRGRLGRYFWLGVVVWFGGMRLAAQTAISWGTTSAGSWTTGANWTGGNPPADDLTTNFANFDNATGVTVTDNSTFSIAGIEFGASAGAYTLSATSGPGRTLTLGSYGVKSYSSADQTITGGKLTLTLGAATSFLVEGSGALTISASNGSIATTATNTLTLGGNGAGLGTVSSQISGAGSVTKIGTGTWVLSSTANNYTGSTNIGTAGGANAGTLMLGANNVLPGTTLNVYGGTLDLNTRTDTVGAINLGGGASGTAATISGTTGTLTLGGTLTYSAANNANGAVVSANVALGGANRTIMVNDSSAAATDLTLGAADFTDTITLGTSTLTVDGAGNTLINAAVGASGDTGGFTKNGTGTVTFFGNLNNYTGTTTVNEGTLVLDTSNSFVDQTIRGNLVIGDGTGSATVIYGTGLANDKIANTSQITINADGTLDLNSKDDTVGSFILTGGHVTTGTGVLTLNGNVTTNASANAAVFDGVLSLGGTTRTFTVANGAATSDLTINATLNSGSIIKAGAGTMTITGDNSIGYGGTTAINAGVLNIQNSLALGQAGANDPTKGTTVASGAALQVQGNIAVGTEALTLSGTGISTDGALRNISGNNSWAGAVTLNAATRVNSDAGTLTLSGAVIATNQNLTVGGAGNTTISGAIGTGSGTITKDGTGTLTLTGDSTYTGATTVSAGVVNIQHSNALGSTSGGVTVANLAALQLQGGITVGSEALSLTGTGVSNDGALRNISGNNSWAGTTTLAGATRINSDAGLLTLAGNVSATNQNLTVGGAGNTTINGAIATGTGTLTKDGAGTLILGGANTYSGTTTVSAGTLRLGPSGSINDVSAVTVSSGATLDVNGRTETVASLAGAGSVQLNGGALTLAGSTTTAYSGTMSGPGTLVRAGTGTLSLDGNLGGPDIGAGLPAFGGNVTITGGILQVNVDNIFSGTLTMSAGTLRLSNSADLTVTNLNITGNSTIDFAGTANILDVTNFTISAGVTLTIRNWQDATDFFFTDTWSGAAFDTINAAPMNRIVFDTDGANPTTYTAAQTKWQGYDNQITPVPEPSTYGALLMGAGLTFFALRRWRNRAVRA
jgi:fibronectin-binding autotransporter adhesin